MEQSESTAANLDRRSRRRWFQAHSVRPLSRMTSSRRWLQFSLRGFLVVLAIGFFWLGQTVETIGCLFLAWKVERARKRGRAIDAIVATNATVLYENVGEEVLLSRFAFGDREDHFWLDLKSIPVAIALDGRLDATIGLHLSNIYNINELEVGSSVESDLQYLEGIRGTCEIILYKAEAIGDEAIERLQKKLPRSEITWVRAGR